ncbi:MAG: HNH endonuclease family protein [Actinomycetes bacterium]
MFPIGNSQATDTSTASKSQYESALTSLNKLSVKGRAPKTGYSREQFPHWKDPDKNGCDSRNDILKRDLSKVVFKTDTNNCKVIAGTLLDPYSNKLIEFDLSKSASTIDIDHVVALSNAWQTGAFQLTLIQRTNFANDPLNLLAVDFKLNRQKGDADAATWLPPYKSYRCTYVARQVAVKTKYKLWVTAPEKAAISNLLTACIK